LAYSEDGLHWNTVENDPFTGTKQRFVGCQSIAFADGMFVAAGASEDGTTIAYSTDGVVWRQSPYNKSLNLYCESVVYGGGTWFASFYTILEPIGYVSSYSTQPSVSWSYLLYQNNNYIFNISVFPTNTEGQYAWFNKGIQLLQTNNVSQPFTEVTEFSSFSNVARGVIGNETTLVIFSNDDKYLYTSSDGANGTWSQSHFVDNSENIINGLLYGNNVWVAAGGGLYYSDDQGVTWINTNISDVDFNNIAFNGKEWQAYTNTNKMYYSQDGKVWNETFSFDQPINTIQSKLPGTILAILNTE
jgi:hypothetical protein